jgi:hypothetical protein
LVLHPQKIVKSTGVFEEIFVVIEEWPADDLIWVLLIYPGLNELVIGLQGDADFSNSCLKLRLI